jgi:hypothetical protein
MVVGSHGITGSAGASHQDDGDARRDQPPGPAWRRLGLWLDRRRRHGRAEHATEASIVFPAGHGVHIGPARGVSRFDEIEVH